MAKQIDQEKLAGLIDHDTDMVELFRAVHARKRAANLDAARKRQVPLDSLQISAEDWAAIQGELSKPFVQAEAGNEGLDYLSLTVNDLAAGGPENFRDFIHALIREHRKASIMQNLPALVLKEA